MKIYLLFMLFVSSVNICSQNVDCFKDTILDASNKIEYKLKNDTTVVLTVTIDKHTIQAEYEYFENWCVNIPDFVSRYKDTFILLNGHAFTYRLLTLFQLEGDSIIKREFQNDCMVDSYTGEIEKLFFVYENQPAMLYMYWKTENPDGITGIDTFIKFYNKKYKISPGQIENIDIDKTIAIVNFKNGKNKIFSLRDFITDNSTK